MVVIKFLYTLYAWTLWVLMGFWAFLWAFLVSVTQGEKGLAKIITGYEIFARCWLFMVGMRLKMKGMDIKKASSPCIVVSNHGSNLDMMTAPIMLPKRVSPLAKEELKKIPMLGYMFKATAVFVNRKDAESRKRSLEEMKGKLSRGIYIFMYPEGTRNRTKEPLKDFYDGAFRTAIEIQKPILPLVFVGLRKVAPIHRFVMQPGTITGEFLPPVSTEGLTEADVPALKEKIFSMMYDYIKTNDPYFNKKK